MYFVCPPQRWRCTKTTKIMQKKKEKMSAKKKKDGEKQWGFGKLLGRPCTLSFQIIPAGLRRRKKKKKKESSTSLTSAWNFRKIFVQTEMEAGTAAQYVFLVNQQLQLKLAVSLLAGCCPVNQSVRSLPAQETGFKVSHPTARGKQSIRWYYLCRASLLVCQAFSALLLRLRFSGFKNVVWEIETLPIINQYSSTKKSGGNIAYFRTCCTPKDTDGCSSS